ncbi:serine/threonine protein phosphatase [Verrucomicrobia bacterium]|nr:serine/threonine protein phosphatase [Verrucomicrobiota bacterium]
MKEVKDTKRATVQVGFDGRVHKRFLGPFAERRFENEVRILKYLEQANCSFVPRLLQEDPEQLYIVTSNCGNIANKLSEERAKEIFKELESFGVQHGDPFPRNITYSPHLGRFCMIDFEFATIMETGVGLTIEDLEAMKGSQ